MHPHLAPPEPPPVPEPPETTTGVPVTTVAPAVTTSPAAGGAKPVTPTTARVGPPVAAVPHPEGVPLPEPSPGAPAPPGYRQGVAPFLAPQAASLPVIMLQLVHHCLWRVKHRHMVQS